MGEENAEKKSVQKEVLLRCHGRFQVGTRDRFKYCRMRLKTVLFRLAYRGLMYKQIPPSCQQFRIICSHKSKYGDAMFLRQKKYIFLINQYKASG